MQCRYIALQARAIELNLWSIYYCFWRLKQVLVIKDAILTSVNDNEEPNNRQGMVYKIKCYNSLATYVGKMGNNLSTRLTKYRRAIKKRVTAKTTFPSTTYKQITELTTGTLLNAFHSVWTTTNYLLKKVG